MRRDLSSGLTIIYKFILPTLWTTVVIVATIFVYSDSNSFGVFLMLLMILPILLFTKLKKVTFDDKFIYVSNWRTETIYELTKLKSINESNMSRFDPFFELEIRNKKGEIDKIEFMPRVKDDLTFRYSGELTGRLLELKKLRVDKGVSDDQQN